MPDVVDERDSSAGCFSSSLPGSASRHPGNTRSAARIPAKDGHNISDVLVIAAALEAECTNLYFENLNDDQTIDGETHDSKPLRRIIRLAVSTVRTFVPPAFPPNLYQELERPNQVVGRLHRLTTP